MTNTSGCFIIQRVLLPLVLILCALLRPVGISFVYLFMFFILPFVPQPKPSNFKGIISAYYIILLSLCTIIIICHIGLQTTIAIVGFDNIIGKCTFTELLLRHMGFIHFGNLRATAVIEWLLPEIIVLVTTIVSYVILRRITFPRNDVNSSTLETATILEQNEIADKKTKQRKLDTLQNIAPVFSLASLFFAGVLRPSVPGGLYFLVFLSSATYWASFRNLKSGFSIVLRIILVIFVFHTILIVSYQTPWPQQHIGNNTLLARLIALEPLIQSSCEKDIRIMYFNTWFKLDSFLAPIAVLVAYQIIALSSKIVRMKKVSLVIDNMVTEPREHTPLITKPFKKSSRFSSKKLDPEAPSIILENLNRTDSEDDLASSVLDQIIYGIISVWGFIYQNSYIFTNILMMTWSIVYHSWLTFIFLIWANVLWMIPNQRKAMMRSSPFIVVYAELLLLAQYVYGMNLSNEELPSKVNTTGINLQQIGFIKPSETSTLPSFDLVIKTIFTLMFWVTLRQTCKEAKEVNRTALSSSFASAFTTSVRATMSDYDATMIGKKSSKFLKKAGDIIKNLLVRLWIWLLIFVIFLCAIAGKRMTGFRICYMALFLFFLLVFQASSKIWMKIMYGFWLFLIFYAMSILTLIYTYQFDKFDVYWSTYLNISKTLQEDIGLEKYATKDLFLHLVSPTIIVILTVIQVHYFHKRLVAALQQTTAHIKNESKTDTIPIPTTYDTTDDITDATNEEQQTTLASQKLHSFKVFIKKWLKRLKSEFETVTKNFKEVVWLFLELHIMKAVYFSAFICCVTEVCVLHILFSILCVVGVLCKQRVQICISRFISFLVSIIILAKMIYQVGYLSHTKYDIICHNNTSEIPLNNAAWFGLEKTTDGKNLVQIIKKYIVYMVIVTIHAVVQLRQSQIRSVNGQRQNSLPHVLFPSITRKDAEVNLIGLIKYLFNYGYYKFGLEITCICLVALITHRQDAIAIIYCFWVCLLVLLDRAECAKAWPFFQGFTAIIIVLQYIFFVGLPPGLCLVYPWESSAYSEGLQLWGLLQGGLYYSHVYKLIFDYVLLMFICRQKKVFIVERKVFNELTEYPGGSNKSVVHDIENLGSKIFENNTSDFITNVRNWLDIIKYAVLCGFFWVTLAVVFLAGTYITDLLAIGYLVGSFVFLWQGSDFYLRPINQILKRWNRLLYYNIFNIALKTLLQIASCIFMDSLKKHACWLVHVLGLTCSQRTGIKIDLNIEDITKCANATSSPVMVWDAICFAFLIFQLRIFKSHYFCHIINNTKANTILASRGAELIEDLRRKQIEHRKKHEQEVLRKIKKKMEKIRATQQKMLRPAETHPEEAGDTAPLAGSSNLSSCHGTGYHTPIEDNNNEIQDEFVGLRSEFEGLFPFPNSNCHATSPSSAGLTVSLDGYMEPKRMSFESPFDIDLLREKSSIDSTPMFSPASVLKTSTTNQQTAFLNGVNNLDKNTRQHRRQSSGNTVSWNEPVEFRDKFYNNKINMCTSDLDDQSSILRQRSFSKKRSNVLNSSYYGYDDRDMNFLCCNKRRLSNISIGRGDDNVSTRTSSHIRPYSWGPISNIYFLESLMSEVSHTSSHGESIRAGDYYMFEDMDDKFKLDVIDDGDDFLEHNEQIAATDNKIKRKKRLLLDSDDKVEEILSQDRPQSSDEFDTITKTEEISRKESDLGPDANERSTNKFIRLIENILLSVAIKLNKFSRNYRYVMKILGKEKKILRESKGFEKGIRTGAAQIWTPFLYLRKHIANKNTDIDDSGEASNQVISELDVEDDDFTSRDHNIFTEVLISAWYAILSNTDIVCYFVVFLNQVVNASIISLPLPMMVFLWGTLSLPRPTKTFWVTLIAYTQSLVLVKCVFQFKLIWSNYINLPNQPLSAAKIIGVEVKKHYAVFDLLLLLLLFLHRFVLKSQGLWKSENKDDIIEEGVLVEADVRDQDSNMPKTDSTNSAEEIQVSALVSSKDDNVRHSGQDESRSLVDVDQSVYLHSSHNHIPGLAKMSRAKYFSSIKNFFHNLVNKTRLPTDVYAVMFLCDFINFFVLLFGFTAFGSQQGDGGVQTYLQENKVPIPFLIMLLVQFILIVIDRALYLRKALVNKIIFHYCSVIGIHVWMFFVIPAVTERSFYSLAPPVIFYVIKCFYLLLSSHQIKCGFPKRILGNFLTKGFNLMNMISFKVYMLIPFLYELRTLLDWVCTDTTMTVFDWLKMEDIFAEVFFIKCSRQMEKDFPAARAERKAMITKVILGGAFILIIVISIWGPLCLFALGNAVGQSNVPYQVAVSLRIGPYDPIYETNNRESLFPFDAEMMTNLQGPYILDKQALTFITNYDPGDIAAIVLPANAPSLWKISPPDEQNLLGDLTNNVTLVCRLTYAFSRVPPNKGGTATISSEVTFDIDAEFPGRNSMIKMLQGTGKNETIIIPQILPKFIKVLNSGDMTIVTQLMSDNNLYRPLILRLFADTERSKNVWWEIKENCNDSFYENTLRNLPYAKCDAGMVMYTFNDKKFPSTFSILTAGGIIGLYTTFVLLASRFMKSFISGQSRRIMFEDLPYVDRVLQLCLDIYLVREALEFALEEDLFAKLLFLYRSPETMIKWTRPKQDQLDGDSESERSPNPTSTRDG